MDGQYISDGLIIANEVDVRMSKVLYSQLNEVYPPLAQSLKRQIENAENKDNPLSLGQYFAYYNMLDTFKEAKGQKIYDGTVKLSPKSRLSFAPDIEEIQISTDENGVCHISGTSKDKKQSIEFAAINNSIQIAVQNENFSKSFNNRESKWQSRDLKSTIYNDDETGKIYAKELIDIVKNVAEKKKNLAVAVTLANSKVQRL